MARMFTPEQILDALAKAEGFYRFEPTQPQTTEIIGRVVRKFHGHSEWARGNADVLPGLRKLVDDGRMVSSYRGSRAKPMPGDDEHRYLFDGRTGVRWDERIWATTEVAEAWKATLAKRGEHRAELNRQASALSAALSSALSTADALPPGDVNVSVAVGEDTVEVSLSLVAAYWLTGVVYTAKG
jgi:hypothetical protein